MRNFWQEIEGEGVVVHSRAESGFAVADDEVIDVHDGVVARDLIEDLLGNWHGGGLVFDYHLRFSAAVADECVAALAHAVDAHHDLVSD